MEQAQVIIADGKVHRPVLDETVTNDDLQKAREELNETNETKIMALRDLREMLQKQHEFLPRTDDLYLLRFLRCRKFDCEKAFKLIREHYKFRATYPGVFPSPSSVEKTLKSNIYNYLPHRDHKGRAIFVIKLKNWNPSKTSFFDYVAAGNLVSEYVLDNHVTQINGYIGLWDVAGLSLKHCMTFCNTTNMFVLLNLMQDRFPGRFKVAYIINCPPLVDTMYSICGPFLKEKFKNRIKILDSDLSKLHKYVHPSILPEEYGGLLPPSDCKEIAQLVLDKEAYFNYNRKFGFDKNDVRRESII